jgi:ATP-dependent Clp protease ATP-binding subunit ClpC
MAKALTRFLFGSTDALIRLDMSEYQEKHTVSKLIGSPPGYVGYDEGGQLTERIRRKPYAVILLDEIEKAHPHVFDTFLQVLDDGHLTDSHGVNVDFKNTLIIMTSNVGTEDLKKYHARGGDRMFQVMVNSLKEHFRPEFLNRIDDIIPFNDLDHQSMLKIVDLNLQDLIERAAGAGYTLEINPAARDFLARHGFDEEYGARPILRAIQTYVEDELSLYLVEHRYQRIKSLSFDILEYDGDQYKTIIKSRD